MANKNNYCLDYLNQIKNALEISSDNLEYIKNAFLTSWTMAIDSQWINIENSLPPLNHKVFIIYNDSNKINFASVIYQGEKEWLYNNCKVIGWMKIPPYHGILKTKIKTHYKK